MHDPVPDDAVSVWLDDLKNADESAASKLWNHFFQRLHTIAKTKLNTKTAAVYNEEDAVQSAFLSFCNGIAAGRFPDLNDRQSLWKLLIVITIRKIMRRQKYDQRQKRDIGRSVGQFVFSDYVGDVDPNTPTDRLMCQEPNPEFVAEFAETCDSLYAQLDDPKLQQVLRWRLEGFTINEIADRTSCSRRTIQRSMELIRRRWQELEPNGE